MTRNSTSGAPDMRTLSDIIFRQVPLILPVDTSVREACRHMRERRAGSVLVVDKKGQLAGIFTGRDAVCRVLAEETKEEACLGDVMTPSPDTMSPDQTALDALRLMWDGGFRHVPVVQDGKILGVVCRGDFTGLEEERLDEERNLWEHMR